MPTYQHNVRFTPESGHGSAVMMSALCQNACSNNAVIQSPRQRRYKAAVGLSGQDFVVFAACGQRSGRQCRILNPARHFV
jgi:hypothetical protein